MWYALGKQRGTNEEIIVSGSTKEEVMNKLKSMSYPVDILMVWKNDE